MKSRIIIGLFLIILIPINIFSADTNKKINTKLKKIDDLYKKYNEDKDNLEILKKATNIFDSLVSNHPNNDELLWKAAESCYKLAEEKEKDKIKLKIYKKGKKYASKSIDINSKCGMGYFWKATLTAKIAQSQGIAKSISMIKPMRNMAKKSIKYNPDFGPAYHLLAKIYTKAPGWPISIGDDKKALHYRIKSTEFSPNNYSYKWELYKNYKNLDKTEKAIETLNSIINSETRNNFHEKLKKIAKKELKEIK